MTREEAIICLQGLLDNPLINKGSYLAQALEMAIQALSQEQKSGKWIKVKSGDKDFPESIVCSRCSNENSHLDFNENAEPIGKVFVTSKYCPNCGAKMESEE